jgi:hypothetical protein
MIIDLFLLNLKFMIFNHIINKTNFQIILILFKYEFQVTER